MSRSNKKAKYVKKSFESTGTSSDTSANIYMSMLMSSAWKALTPRQHDLYLYCKAQYYAEKKKPIADNPLSFTMSKSKWNGLYELYTSNNRKYFYEDMDALISKGFVVCLECGATTRTKSIYAFSDKWRLYGTDKFEVLPSEKTMSMVRKLRKEKAGVSV